MSQNFAVLAGSKTDPELREIYIYRERFDKDFFPFVKAELQKREADLELLDAQRAVHVSAEINVLERGKTGNPAYIFICMALAIFGGLLGIFAGYIYAYSTTTGIDGGKFYVYESETRRWGRIMFFTGLAVFSVILIWKLNGANFG